MLRHQHSVPCGRLLERQHHSEMMHRIQELQAHRNIETRTNWEAFRGHREQVTQLLTTAAGSRQSRLCVLGAGNCNDLALPELLNCFREIHLVDLDWEALEIGVKQQALADSPRVFRYGVDVTGVSARFAGWTLDHVTPDGSINECLADLQAFQLPAPRGPFQVVASVCLLSQLIDIVNLTMGEQHPRFV